MPDEKQVLSCLARCLVLILLFTGMAAAAGPRAKSTPTSCSAWQDSFNTGQLDPTRWTVGSGQAPGYIANYHIGYYDPSNVSLTLGLLALQLTQATGTVDTNPAGVISRGAIIYTNFKCGYGTYEWTMRMSSTAGCPACEGTPVSGSVSAGFLYVNNSQTEIDFEFQGGAPHSLWLVNWRNPTPQLNPTSSDETYTELYPFDATSTFHDYKFVWSRKKISYYVDGVWKADHTTNVPTAPAYFMINTWGSDSGNWGGTATLGTTRYFYISKASYTP